MAAYVEDDEKQFRMRLNNATTDVTKLEEEFAPTVTSERIVTETLRGSLNRIFVQSTTKRCGLGILTQAEVGAPVRVLAHKGACLSLPLSASICCYYLPCPYELSLVQGSLMIPQIA